MVIRGVSKKKIIAELKKCDSRESVHDVFDNHQIIDKEERIEYLNEAMGSLETFYSSGDPDLHAKYEREVSILLTKPWELNALYEKAGL